MGGILVAGAINTDLVANVERAPEAGETVTGLSFAIHSGGKGANQCVAAARSGAETVMLGGVGPDDFGAGRKADLEREGIDTSWIDTIDGVSSGVAMITVEASGENRICYIPAATLNVPASHASMAVETVQPGMILAANELSPECHRVLFRWASDNDVPVLFNVAPYSAEAVELVPLADVLIVNRGEAAALQQADASGMSAELLARGLRAMGAKDIVITLGEDGALVMTGEDLITVPAIEVDVVDTTGAGDTFCGALAARMLEGESLRDAVRYANVAGGLSTTRPGAQPSIPTRDEVERALADVAGEAS